MWVVYVFYSQVAAVRWIRVGAINNHPQTMADTSENREQLRVAPPFLPHDFRIVKRGSSNMCALCSVIKPGQNCRKMGMRLFQNNDDIDTEGCIEVTKGKMGEKGG